MDVFNLNISSHDFGDIKESERNPLLLLAEVSTSQWNPLGHSVQTLNLSHSGYLDQQTNQDTKSCPLNHCSISHSPHTESELRLVKWLSKNTQQPVATETVEFQATDSSGVGGPTPLALEDGYVSGTSKTSQTAYVTSNKGKTSHTNRYAKYARSVKGKVTKAKYNTSDKGKAVKANYLEKCKMSDIAKMRKAVRCAKWYAYRTALKKGYSEKLARNKGELAAKSKMAKLSFVSSKLIRHNAE